ncbi:hypothetical protein KFZ70_06840 [Tamlana fucoidanivorans]|uniref:Right-handed parallel beta-helix repeat-containing protein n=1 Tax=Allotamlana fucoidanivorans TaxID=2583814 RepID=A0A5C4SMG7_9FLAO|nr:hypothetical protein [Tamlana fucoidanivorans]TNJ45273.1 hypothetical protein FGF67_06065 [Tamlana fucoidanivorans]
MKKNIYILTISILVLISCNKEDIMFEHEQNLSNADLSYNALSDAIIVAPSNDMSGVEDANNIEAALELAKASGSTVYLSDGLMNTKDHYYLSRSVRTEGFNGAFLGEGKNKTLIHVGRKSDTEGFTGVHSTGWGGFVPNVFQFDKPTGDVTIKNLAILIKDDAPRGTGSGPSFIGVALELIGGSFNAHINNIRIEGKASQASGNLIGYNLNWGIHVMPWGDFNPGQPGPPPRTQGSSLTIKNIDFENLAWNAISFMDFGDASKVLIDQISAKKVGTGVAGGRANDSDIMISNVEINCHDATNPQGRGLARGMVFWEMASAPTITDCMIKNSNWWWQILIVASQNATITNTSFVDCQPGNAAIVINNSTHCNIIQNDYRDNGLPGWTENSNGPGAVFMNPGSSNNYVHEMKFPARLTVCDMVRNLGSNNTIHNWEACD